MRCEAPCGYLIAGPRAQDAQWRSRVHEQRNGANGVVWLARRVDTGSVRQTWTNNIYGSTDFDTMA